MEKKGKRRKQTSKKNAKKYEGKKEGIRYRK